ncbi:hypothetical protein PoB_006789300 [Plakobranchus ocellatus]|uniref:Uncharacterized protein n=1 Tax=Plakobranchus ocellatus TaxID=259542 RepID=A0AAV4DB06_9GAST|nr:hypothetical protein PoB_006789300 [Plakobranchus ocellatus]
MNHRTSNNGTTATQGEEDFKNGTVEEGDGRDHTEPLSKELRRWFSLTKQRIEIQQSLNLNFMANTNFQKECKGKRFQEKEREEIGQEEVEPMEEEEEEKEEEEEEEEW